jgi:hypothetical protein
VPTFTAAAATVIAALPLASVITARLRARSSMATTIGAHGHERVVGARHPGTVFHPGQGCRRVGERTTQQQTTRKRYERSDPHCTLLFSALVLMLPVA